MALLTVPLLESSRLSPIIMAKPRNIYAESSPDITIYFPEPTPSLNSTLTTFLISFSFLLHFMSILIAPTPYLLPNSISFYDKKMTEYEAQEEVLSVFQPSANTNDNLQWRLLLERNACGRSFTFMVDCTGYCTLMLFRWIKGATRGVG